jgi:formylglycine-generating enzyme required for sulfatase activity
VFAVFAAVAVFFASILAPQFLQPHAVRAFNTITVLTESVAKELSQFAGDEIDLSGVKSLDSSAARELAKWRGVSLNLSGLESVDQNTAAQLAAWRGQTLDLSGLKNLPPPAAKSLAEWPGKFLRLAGLKTMPLNSARELAACRVASLDLLGLVSAGDEILAILRVNPGISLPQVPTLNEGLHADDLPKSITNSIGIKLNRIPAGTFTMGEGGQAHRVTLTKPFFIGVTEVTNAQWKAVMGDIPSQWKDDERPVEQVSWDDAVSFCKKLSSLPAERTAGRVYRLPTEAEWEYACRAGSATAYSFGDRESLLGIFAWFSENAGKQTHAVGKKQPNAWGLHDMHGNGWEWCSDWYGDYPRGSVTDPHGPASGSHRVNRGGCWYNSAWRCRSASRGSVKPSYRHYFLGFRLALSSSGSKPAKKKPVEPPKPVAAGGRINKPLPLPAGLPEIFTNSIGVRMKLLPAGTFTMGDANGRRDETHREVTLTKPFYLGVTEVTNAQWKAVMESVPSKWKDDERPVEQVSWEDAFSFCKTFSSLPAERAAGRVYRLPTEAEWEYACRAGSADRYWFGDDESQLGDFGWYTNNSRGLPHHVAGKKPNGWGLYDMHGNVWEWCSDRHGGYPGRAVSDPQGPLVGVRRIGRGGSWCHPAGMCRSAIRHWNRPFYRDSNAGFRLALSPSDSQPPEAGQ